MTTALLVVLAPGFVAPAPAQPRSVETGDGMAPFALVDIDGRAFAYEPRRGRASVLSFMAAYQKRSDRALDDLLELTGHLRRAGHPVDLILVISGGQGREHFIERLEEAAPEVTILLDPDDALWGRLGVEVTPTTFLIDGQGTIAWIRAGHGYDFATEARARLHQALGLDAAPTPAVAPEAEPAPQESPERRAARHVRLGKVLARKGRVEAGIAELRKADALTPDAVAVRLELAHLLCRAERAEEALAVAETIRPSTPAEQARVMVVTGWAHRQLGHPERALALLTEAVSIDPRSRRGLYELGRVFELQGECEKAMQAYRRAVEMTDRTSDLG